MPLMIARGLAKPAVWFAFTTDRRAEHPKSMLKDFRGHLQADAYPGYDDLYRTGRIVEVGCWGHARRKIFDLHENRPTAVTTELLERIARLYNVEEDVRATCRVRQASAQPLWNRARCRFPFSMSRAERAIRDPARSPCASPPGC